MTMTLEWQDTTSTKVLAKMQSDDLDIGLEKGMQIQSSSLVRTADLACIIKKARCFCTMPQNYSKAK